MHAGYAAKHARVVGIGVKIGEKNDYRFVPRAMSVTTQAPRLQQRLRVVIWLWLLTRTVEQVTKIKNAKTSGRKCRG